MTRQRHDHPHVRRWSLLDALHIGVIILCSAWTAKIIAEERFGSIRNAATELTHIARIAHPDVYAVTIRLDDGARTAAR